jgi:Fe-S-cluster-containing hydrogenase component 2
LGLARLVVTKDMARYEFDIVVCKHCDEPDCMLAACPHDAIFYNEPQDRYLKCDLCAGREQGPLCVEMCPVQALTLVAAEPVAVEV